jgi:metal-responsive CopG/Arc/MetJ family transcriptional regulator
MKTAISLPDEVYAGAERLARKLRKSRSQLYAEAVAEYVARHDPEAVSDAMNRICEEIGTQVDRGISAAARRILERTEWE